MEKPLWFLALGWLFTILGLMGNSLVIVLIMSKKQLIRRKTNWFLVSLSFADLGVSLSMFPGNVFCLPSKFCHFVLLASFQWAFLYASVLNLCVLTLDRYIAVVRPFIYVLFMSMNRGLAFICAAWVIPFIFSFLPFTFLYSDHNIIAMKKYSYFMVVAFEFLPTIMLVLVTAQMIYIAKKHARERSSVMAQLSYNQPAAERSNAENMRQKNRRRKSVLFIVSIVACFVLCYSAILAMTFCKNFELCVPPRALFSVSQLFLIANSAFNPFAYGFLKHDIKAEVKQLLRFGTGEGQRSSIQMEQR